MLVLRACERTHSMVTVHHLDSAWHSMVRDVPSVNTYRRLRAGGIDAAACGLQLEECSGRSGC